jgi:hypothetical protein
MTLPRPRPRSWLCRAAGVLLLSLMNLPAHAERILEARYAEPVERYGHFALGRPHEYARVVVRTDAGRELTLDLPSDAVFEDLAPRRVQLTADAPTELLVIVSTRRAGARLALVGLHEGRLALVANAAPIGTPNRWLNPVGVADLDGDGEAEIAAVITPHIGGVLTVYRRRGDQLVVVDRQHGFSNHVYGSPELALSTPATVAGRPVLLVPDQPRTSLRVVALRGGRLLETDACAVAEPITGPEALRTCEARLARSPAR